jgi:CHAD domain-containing protein
MRSQLKSFSVALDATWLEEVRSDLGWLAAGLGAVRDSDVMIQRIRRCAADLPPVDQAPAAALVARLESAREDAAEVARAMLVSQRCSSLTERLRAAAADPPVLPIGSEPAADLASAMVSSSWRRLERSVASLPAVPADEDLHEVRIRAKQCRYTSEVLAPVMGARYRRLARALTDLQGVLGDIHDSHCTQECMRASVESPAEALAAGMMIAAEARDHAALLRCWPDVWLRTQKARPETKRNRRPKPNMQAKPNRQAKPSR